MGQVPAILNVPQELEKPAAMGRKGEGSVTDFGLRGSRAIAWSRIDMVAVRCGGANAELPVPAG